MNSKKDKMLRRCPHFLDDKNYDNWKVYMSTLIKSLSMKVWQYLVTEWIVPTITKNWRIVIKFELEWNCEERKAASRNFTTLLVIHFGMDDKTFKLIATSESAKEAWDTL